VRIMEPEYRLSARQVATYLQDTKHVAMATVTARGEPRVSPVDALFIRGRFYISTGGSSLRVRHLRVRPSISITHFVGDEIAVVVHGRATLIERGDPDAEMVNAEFTRVYGSSPYEWSPNTIFIRVDPERMLTYSRTPERYPE
jgi:uncharacterized pyridoxamine 5'-phosphate oxidase family protein